MGIVAAPSSLWIACSAARNRRRARPLNSVVRHHVKERALLTASVLLAGSLLAACASAGLKDQPQDPFAMVAKMERDLNGSCRYSVLEKVRGNSEMMCAIEALRKRCNKIDDCLVYCAGNDIGADIGGGCAHLCRYRDERYEPSQEAIACFKGS